MADDPTDTTDEDAPDAAADEETTDDADAEEVDDAADADPDEAADDEGDEGDDEEAEDPERAARKAKADKVIAERRAKDAAVVAERKVNRRTVTSRRVTPRPGEKADAPAVTSKARDAKKTESVVNRSSTPVAPSAAAKGPSPWWVPTIMFALLIIGALIIMANYMVGDGASNVRLVIGLGFILAGIIAATQYR